MTARPEVPIFVGKHWTFATEMRLGRFYVLRHNELPACMKLELWDGAQHWRWEINLVDERDVKICHTSARGIEALVGQMRVIHAVTPGALCRRHAECVTDNGMARACILETIERFRSVSSQAMSEGQAMVRAIQRCKVDVAALMNMTWPASRGA